MSAFQAGLIALRMEDYPRAEELSGPDRWVLVTLFSFAADDDRPQAYASAPRIAARSGLSRSTVQRSLAHLEEVGAIHGEHRHRKPTRWSLDPYFVKHGSVAPQPTSVRETPGKRQRDAQQGSERRSAGVRERLQGTEVGSGAKRRNRTDVTKGGSASGKPARSARRAPSAPPPTPGAVRTTAGMDKPQDQRPKRTSSRKRARRGSPTPAAMYGLYECKHAKPDGLMVRGGRFSCHECESIAPHPDRPDFRSWATPELRAYVAENAINCRVAGHTRVAQSVAEAVWRQSPQPRDMQTYRLFQAWAVDRLEPGRVNEVLAGTAYEAESGVPWALPT